MPVINGKGTSQCTPTKVGHFTCAMQMHATLAAGILKRDTRYNPRYIYLDLNAGDGQNIVNGRELPGSPLIAARAIKAAQLDAVGVCFEENPVNASRLRARLKDHASFRVVEGDHFKTIDEVMRAFNEDPDKRKRLGVVYTDPNGQIPIEVLSNIFRNPTFSTVDCMAYVGANSAYKRPRGVWPGNDNHHLLGALESIPKKYIHIRVPDDRSQWTMVLLTNWEGFPKLTNRGFYRIDTPRGQEIADRLFKTGEELAGQKAAPWMLEIQETYRQSRSFGNTSATIAIQQTLEF